MDTTYRLEYISTFQDDIIQVASSLEAKKAARILQKLDKILANLILLPEMFPIHEDIPIFRKIVIEEYLVFYTFDRFSGLIEIHRLLYGAMDIPQHI